MLHLQDMSTYICIVVKENLPVGSHCDITTNHTLNRKYSKQCNFSCFITHTK